MTIQPHSGQEQPASKEHCPKMIKIAATFLCLLGFSFFLVGAYIALEASLFATRRHAKIDIAGTLSSGILALCGSAFIYVSIQMVRGRLSDTLVIGTGSVIVALGGLASLFPLVLKKEASPGTFTDTAFALWIAGFAAVGILALVSRTAYKAWRKRRKS